MSAHRDYLFALHNKQKLPWGYEVMNGILTLRATECDIHVRKANKACNTCETLAENSTVKAI